MNFFFSDADLMREKQRKKLEEEAKNQGKS